MVDAHSGYHHFGDSAHFSNHRFLLLCWQGLQAALGIWRNAKRLQNKAFFVGFLWSCHNRRDYKR